MWRVGWGDFAARKLILALFGTQSAVISGTEWGSAQRVAFGSATQPGCNKAVCRRAICSRFTHRRFLRAAKDTVYQEENKYLQPEKRY